MLKKHIILAALLAFLLLACDRYEGELPLLEVGSAGAIVDTGDLQDDSDNTITGDVGQFASLAFGSDDRARIAYYDLTRGNLKFALEKPGEGWQLSVLDGEDADVGRYTSLALDEANHYHIAYYDSDNSTLKYLRQGDEPRIIESSSDDVGRYSDLTLDLYGNPQICYHNYTDRSLHLARFNGTDFLVDRIDGFPTEETAPSAGTDTTQSGVGEYCSIEVDPLNRTWIAYYSGRDGGLRLALVEESTATVVLLDGGETGIDVGEFSSLALDGHPSPDNPQLLEVTAHIAYFDRNSSDLRYIEVDGQQLTGQVTVVDSEGFVGTDTSIALNDSLLPRVAYFDGTNCDLRIAYYTGESWEYQTLSSAGFVGIYNSLAFSLTGRAAVATYDKTNGDLRFHSFIDRW
jgi:hypothetical protein